ncbi:MAG: hypothetical protein KOO60_00915 [Gemmatimonadales bacterium]|nr:hypothetical protein [Gemmatimonadales bacterium]
MTNHETDEDRTGRKRPTWCAGPWESFVFCGIAAIIIYQLFVPPIIGVADNGDYHRVMGPLGLEPTVTEWSDCYFDHVNRQYRFGSTLEAAFPTSQVLLGKAALAVSGAVAKGDHFDLTVLGGVNTAVYLLGIYLILLHFSSLSPAARIIGGVFLTLMATDVSNVSFFNSFYSESASLIFLTLMIGVFLTINRQARIRAWHILGFFFIAAFFVAAKPQNHPLAVPVVLIAGVWLWRKTRTVDLLAFAAGGLALLVFAGYLYSSVPDQIKYYNRWNVLFYSILADSPDPRADLSELDLEPDLAAYAGRSAFEEGVPVLEVGGDFNHADLTKFLMKHPLRFVSLASDCAQQIYVKIDPLNGHFEKSSGIPARQQSRDFSQWHKFQDAGLPHSLGWLAFLTIVLAGGVGFIIFRHGPAGSEGGLAWLAAGLGIMAAMEFGICVLGDGTYDIVKHLFLFQVLLDACFLVGVIWLAGRIGEVVQKLVKGPEKQSPAPK